MFSSEDTQLYDKYRGTILVAARVDVNNQLSPLPSLFWKARTTIIGIVSWLVFG